MFVCKFQERTAVLGIGLFAHVPRCIIYYYSAVRMEGYMRNHTMFNGAFCVCTKYSSYATGDWQLLGNISNVLD